MIVANDYKKYGENLVFTVYSNDLVIRKPMKTQPWFIYEYDALYANTGQKIAYLINCT